MGFSNLSQIFNNPTVAVGTELTRPADTNAYAALDSVANSTSAPVVLTFANLARVKGGQGYITKVRVMTDQKTCVAQFRLHLYHTAPTAIDDNSPYTLLYGDKANRVGHVDVGPLISEDPTNSTGAYGENTDVRLPFVCDATDQNLYGLLETLTAFTPASGQHIYVELTAEVS